MMTLHVQLTATYELRKAAAEISLVNNRVCHNWKSKKNIVIIALFGNTVIHNFKD